MALGALLIQDVHADAGRAELGQRHVAPPRAAVRVARARVARCAPACARRLSRGRLDAVRVNLISAAHIRQHPGGGPGGGEFSLARVDADPCAVRGLAVWHAQRGQAVVAVQARLAAREQL